MNSGGRWGGGALGPGRARGQGRRMMLDLSDGVDDAAAHSAGDAAAVLPTSASTEETPSTNSLVGAGAGAGAGGGSGAAGGGTGGAVLSSLLGYGDSSSESGVGDDDDAPARTADGETLGVAPGADADSEGATHSAPAETPKAEESQDVDSMLRKLAEEVRHEAEADPFVLAAEPAPSRQVDLADRACSALRSALASALRDVPRASAADHSASASDEPVFMMPAKLLERLLGIARVQSSLETAVAALRQDRLGQSRAGIAWSQCCTAVESLPDDLKESQVLLRGAEISLRAIDKTEADIDQPRRKDTVAAPSPHGSEASSCAEAVNAVASSGCAGGEAESKASPSGEAEPTEDPHAGLPDGWTAVFDETHKRHYYAEPATGKSTWVKPGTELVPPARDEDDVSLPALDVRSIMVYVPSPGVTPASIAAHVAGCGPFRVALSGHRTFVCRFVDVVGCARAFQRITGAPPSHVDVRQFSDGAVGVTSVMVKYATTKETVQLLAAQRASSSARPQFFTSAGLDDVQAAQSWLNSRSRRTVSSVSMVPADKPGESARPATAESSLASADRPLEPEVTAVLSSVGEVKETAVASVDTIDRPEQSEVGVPKRTKASSSRKPIGSRQTVSS